ncbi:hypothetical protein C482_14809 [Natrialba chahannaoensis JCM 10990]|uniref:Uncharacterized protein n=1 Tax=Natrialba chahannaoensis JCM 10990 TaxID=1227492 RepID=M0AHS9_9EURY|nr:hypothetical protein [Natrialba chahannaoensis]ELY96928.1 hypothetical protein C482_14809 [Natrialba chahannaoensis JCM 10990]
MIGTTLGDIRKHLEALADETGPYYLRCGRTGERPVPAIGLRFDSRSTARAGARATEQYRAALRQYDPQLPQYDVIVCQDANTPTQLPDTLSDSRTPQPRRDGTTSNDTDTVGSMAGDWAAESESLIDFCHAIAGAVFETIADSSHQSIERAIMDTYFEIAETIESPDELCLRLLESMAVELECRLTPAEQATVLLAAAKRLPSPSPPASDEPLELALSRLQSTTLVSDYTLERRPDEWHVWRNSWTVTLDAYSLGQSETGVVTLPLVIELFRHRSSSDVSLSSATAVGDPPSSWTFTLQTASGTAPSGLVSVSSE